MKIHALSTGTVRVKHSFLFARKGMRRQLSLFTPGPFSDPLPIHLWVVEHEGRRILVDTGEVASVNDIPFAKFGGGPVGLSTLAVALGEEPETIEDVYEPYLLQLGFLQRTPRGRVITKLGRLHIGAPAAPEPRLFE